MDLGLVISLGHTRLMSKLLCVVRVGVDGVALVYGRPGCGLVVRREAA